MALKRGLRIYDDLKYNEKFGTLKSLYIKRTKRFVQNKLIAKFIVMVIFE